MTRTPQEMARLVYDAWGMVPMAERSRSQWVMSWDTASEIAGRKLDPTTGPGCLLGRPIRIDPQAPSFYVEQQQPQRLTAHLPVSAEALADAMRVQDLLTWAFTASREERAQQRAAAEAQRAAERAVATPAALTLESLTAALDWSPEYAEHLVQPYCTCGPDRDDGWYVCPHAEDLGLRS